MEMNPYLLFHCLLESVAKCADLFDSRHFFGVVALEDGLIDHARQLSGRGGRKVARLQNAQRGSGRPFGYAQISADDGIDIERAAVAEAAAAVMIGKGTGVDVGIVRCDQAALSGVDFTSFLMRVQHGIGKGGKRLSVFFAREAAAGVEDEANALCAADLLHAGEGVSIQLLGQKIDDDAAACGCLGDQFTKGIGGDHAACFAIFDEGWHCTDADSNDGIAALALFAYGHAVAVCCAKVAKDGFISSIIAMAKECVLRVDEISEGLSGLDGAGVDGAPSARGHDVELEVFKKGCIFHGVGSIRGG